MRYDAIRYDAMRCDTIRYDTLQETKCTWAARIPAAPVLDMLAAYAATAMGKLPAMAVDMEGRVCVRLSFVFSPRQEAIEDFL